MEIIMGAVAEGDQICLVLRNDRRQEGMSPVLFGRLGGSPEWRLEVFELELVAVCAAPPDLRAKSDFLGLTGEGQLVFLSDGSTEPIQGAGVGESWSSDRGRMEDLLLLQTGLLAVGFGGQAYQRVSGGNWAPLAQPFPDPEPPTDIIKFVTAVHQPKADRHALGGMVVTQIPQTGEMRQAGRSGNAGRYASLLVSQMRRDYGTLWLVERGRWREVDLPTNDMLDEMLTAGTDTTYLRFRQGVLYATDDFEEFTEIGLNDDDGFAAMVNYGKQPLVVDEEQIYVMNPDGLTDFEPPLPPGDGYIAVLASADGHLYVIRSESVFRLHGEEWTEVAVPSAFPP